VGYLNAARRLRPGCRLAPGWPPRDDRPLAGWPDGPDRHRLNRRSSATMLGRNRCRLARERFLHFLKAGLAGGRLRPATQLGQTRRNTIVIRAGGRISCERRQGQLLNEAAQTPCPSLNGRLVYAIPYVCVKLRLLRSFGRAASIRQQPLLRREAACSAHSGSGFAEEGNVYRGRRHGPSARTSTGPHARHSGNPRPVGADQH
jgi:hypothetical protein